MLNRKNEERKTILEQNERKTEKSIHTSSSVLKNRGLHRKPSNLFKYKSR